MSLGQTQNFGSSVSSNFCDPDKALTQEDVLSLMQSSPHSSSGYQSQSSVQTPKEEHLLKPDVPGKELITKAMQLNEMFNRPIGPNDCADMSKNLAQYLNRSAYKTAYKGADSFYYIISKFIPNLASSPDPNVMVNSARTMFAKFVNENQEFSNVSNLFKLFVKRDL